MIQAFKTKAFAIQFGESVSAPKEVQLLRTGSFSHDTYGTFEITSQTLADMVRNFQSKVRGVDLAIDYSHESDKHAAGWINDLFLKEDGTELWAKVTWTPEGQKRLEGKEYRYLSADFNFKYTDSESKKDFGPTLFGAGLTNRPFIKSMAPAVELTEIKGGTTMTLEEAKVEIKKLAEENAAMKDEKKKFEDMMNGMSPEEIKAKIAELQSQLEAANSKLQAMEGDKKYQEKKNQFTKLLSEGKVCKAQEEAFMKDDMATFVALAEKVNLKAEGTGEGTTEENTVTDAEGQIIKLAEKLVADKKAKNLAEAQSMVLSDPANAELVKKYQAKFE